MLPVDGVLLDLHGAMVTQQHGRCGRRIHRSSPPCRRAAVPIVITLDLHANITSKMAMLADVIIGFDTYPHVDMHGARI